MHEGIAQLHDRVKGSESAAGQKNCEAACRDHLAAQIDNGQADDDIEAHELNRK